MDVWMVLYFLPCWKYLWGIFENRKKFLFLYSSINTEFVSFVLNNNVYMLCTLQDATHTVQCWTNCHETVQSVIIRSLFVMDEKQSRLEDTWVWRSRSGEWNIHYRKENGADKKRVSMHLVIPLNRNILTIWGLCLSSEENFTCKEQNCWK